MEMMRTISVYLIALGLLSALSPSMVGHAYGQEKVVRGFANFDVTSSDADEENEQIALGQYDAYITGRLGNQVTYLSELVVEYDDGWLVDLERLWVKFDYNSHFSFSIGKFHTPLGYWNREYHHGALLHTSMDRPSMLLFEDEGGILPIHTTGVMFSGTEIGPARLYYDFMVGNGIGSDPTSDNDSNKSFSLYLHSKAVEDVDFGISIYKDKISEGAVVDAHGHGKNDEEPLPLEEDVDQLILGASLAVTKMNWELLAEYVISNNEGLATGRKEDTKGGYLLASYAIGDWSPFARYDLLKVEDDDPFYQPTDTTMISIGVKYDFSPLVNVKAQYSSKDVEGLDKENTIGAQFSIGF